MKFLFTFFLYISFTALVEHDLPIAAFTIYQEAESLVLDVNLDARDLAKELDVKPSEVTVEMIEKYINDNTEFSFDGEQKIITVKELKKKRGHLHIHSVFDTDDLVFTNVRVNNTCLLEVEEHSNVIEIKVNGQDRSFRMNKERTSIEVEL